jgi:hypothetical protein
MSERAPIEASFREVSSLEEVGRLAAASAQRTMDLLAEPETMAPEDFIARLQAEHRRQATEMGEKAQEQIDDIKNGPWPQDDEHVTGLLDVLQKMVDMAKDLDIPIITGNQDTPKVELVDNIIAWGPVEHVEGREPKMVILKRRKPREDTFLFGSSVQPASMTIGETTFSLGDLVAGAHAESFMTPTEWNDQPNDQREALIAAYVDKLQPMKVTPQVVSTHILKAPSVAPVAFNPEELKNRIPK